MTPIRRSILMLGEHDVGKIHFGGQLLKRLMNSDGQLRMEGAATNLEPFQSVMDSLNEGKLADHTATTYDESTWPIVDRQQHRADLVWPDYAGEQLRNITDQRRIPAGWRERIIHSPAWLLLIRPQKIRADNDIFSRPLTSLAAHQSDAEAPYQEEGGERTRTLVLSDQARLIELLQMLLQTRLTFDPGTCQLPRLLILLTCWDEIETNLNPVDILRQRLPMFHDFMSSHWRDLLIFGLSALGRRLDKTKVDMEYVSRGSENFGYVVLANGTQCGDLTLPIRSLLADIS